MLDQCEVDSLKTYVTYKLPVGTTWKHRRGHTLIGDAASWMTPFSGEGVNKAMKDALELAEAIPGSCDSDLTLDEAVKLYGENMFPRATKLRAKTAYSEEMTFGLRTPIGLMTGMVKAMTSESPSLLIRLLGSAPIVMILYSYQWARMHLGAFPTLLLAH